MVIELASVVRYGVNANEVIGELASLVRRYYVFADQAEDLAATVEGWAHSLEDRGAEATANELTKRIRRATGDLHFSRVAQQLTPEQRSTPPEDRWKLTMPGADTNFGFRSVEIDAGTAIVAITALVPLEWSADTAHGAMAFCRHASRVIVDLRRCGGGDPDLIAVLCSYFLGEDPLPLSTTTWRDGQVETLATDPASVPFRFAPEVPLVFVVGPWTASGAEGLVYELQARRRATVVGTRTLGAAHRIKQFDIGNGLVLTIPSGKVTNPITGKDWEGTGVFPDVAVLDGADALDAALKNLGVEASP